MCLKKTFHIWLNVSVLLFIIYSKSAFKMLKIRLLLDRSLSEIQEVVFILAPVRTHIMYINAVFLILNYFLFLCCSQAFINMLKPINPHLYWSELIVSLMKRAESHLSNLCLHTACLIECRPA